MSAPRAALARLAPEPTAALAEVERVAAASVDPHVLELVRDRVASVLGGVPSDLDDWRSRTDLDAADRAVLDFVEQFVFSVSSLDDAQVAALLEHADPIRVHELCNLVWAVDLGTRLDLVAGVVLS
ncbi:hypothetical protein G5V58_19120 [Nocardioides anomalus]|uniref:Uncharacterized protein n=1 Tax=Nocardioides anomalus TaxID=2712223 RepID=A0A6G6WHA6_9ACTN|nr:hypothetical protein [Nocardioides anomalus]QIG44612.1 hypothetical protein G5V58_19120 [Nocardioides anomalus]